MTVPGYWSKTDVACPDGMTEFVVDHSVLICVSNKLLTKLQKKEDEIPEKHLLMNMTLINKITEYKKSVETWCWTINKQTLRR